MPSQLKSERPAGHDLLVKRGLERVHLPAQLQLLLQRAEGELFSKVSGNRTSLGGVPREQKMLEGHLPRLMYHQV